jgi:hypothetical protein
VSHIKQAGYYIEKEKKNRRMLSLDELKEGEKKE